MNPQKLPEAKLAWIIWNALQQLSDRLWDRYDKDFVSSSWKKTTRSDYRPSPTQNSSMNHLQGTQHNAKLERHAADPFR